MIDFTETLNSLEKINNPRMNDGDYVKDGLLYCGKCNTPKQCIIIWPITRETKTVGCICKCFADELRSKGMIY